MLFSRPLQYGVLLSAAVTLSGFEGCRFGNYISPPPASDNVLFYETVPEELVFTATVKNQGSRSAAAATSKVPAMIAQIFTNPVAVVTFSSGQNAFYATNGTGANIMTHINANGAVSFNGAIDPEALWGNTACLTSFRVGEVGQLRAGGPFNSGSNQTLTGRLELEVTVIRYFEGTGCEAALQLMADCRENVSLCDGGSTATNQARHADAQSILGAYLDAGVVHASEVSRLTSLAFAVSYQ